jgi:putative hemolysin
VGGLFPQLALVFALIVLNAAFAGSEIALISLREHQLERLEEQSERGRVLARLARDPNRFLATIQIGITLAGFLASAAAAVALAAPLEEPLSFLGGAAEPVAIVLVTLVLTFVTLVLGELAPKRLAMQRAERWALLAARPVSGLSTVTRPVVWLLSTTSDLVVRLFGGDPARHRDAVTEEELRDLLATQSSLTEDHRTILTEALDIGDRMLRDILIPRRDVVFLLADASLEDGRRRLVETGHSRAPVVNRDLDDVLGLVHLRDLVMGEGHVCERAHPATVLPETVRVVPALRRLQDDREQMAVVVNEHGVTEGIVTVEDLLEEVVGEIYDEVDRDIRSVQRLPDGGFLVNGSFPVHDLVDLDIDLPEGDYATVAGLVLARLGHIPTGPGEQVEVQGWVLEVAAVDKRAITRVWLRPAVTETTQGTGTAKPSGAKPSGAEPPDA